MLTARELAEGISWLCGWVYFLLWSASYYPQPILNYRRRSTEGYTFDFPLLNTYGSACYTLNSAMFLYSSRVRAEYAARHPDSPIPTVRFNDFIYALHALLICITVMSQFWPRLWGWKCANNRKASIMSLILLWGGLCALACFTAFLLVSKSGTQDVGSTWGWIDLAYAMGNIKLLITIFKYIPQVRLIHQRRSTEGLAISAVMMDVVGGVLSLLQLVIDSLLQGNWSGVTANPAKLGLANLSLVADAVFLTQHYLLYPKRGRDDGENEEGETEPLLKK